MDYCSKASDSLPVVCMVFVLGLGERPLSLGLTANLPDRDDWSFRPPLRGQGVCRFGQSDLISLCLDAFGEKGSQI